MKLRMSRRHTQGLGAPAARSELDLVLEGHLPADLGGLLLEHGQDGELVRLELGGLLPVGARRGACDGAPSIESPIAIAPITVATLHLGFTILEVEARVLRQIAHAAKAPGDPRSVREEF